MPCARPMLSDPLPRPLLRQAAHALPLMCQLPHHRWTAEDDEHLVRMFNQVVGPPEMVRRSNALLMLQEWAGSSYTAMGAAR